MGRDKVAEWLQILLTWPFVFAIGIGLILAWRAWRLTQGHTKQNSAQLRAVVTMWFFGAFILALAFYAGPLPLDDYPYRR